ncbi:MAG: glutamate--tRNA ligase [Acidimicrobiia bacterium]|nr:glutamate--tRNA ligase [Acidimicrobiia bacterium]MDH3397651.1 glutamate--tRNA ligase [Acidimicrobiia bacterium]MDH5615090.1 glutamate--tRNA ligase [Acidimicrobiia bacterium]
MTVRVRIAPSPTGLLHVGNARAALFNWLFARHTGGTFILRIDDTDLARSENEYEEDVLTGLGWLGLDWDEGVGVGGPYGTYRQSDRLDRYAEVAGLLLAAGDAYYCFCTPSELDERRKEAQAQGRPPGYDGRCRLLGDAEAGRRQEQGEAAVIRLAVPRPGVTTFDDIVRDEVRFDHDAIDDFVLVRSDGSPTYHLASTVDDVDYQITHVARGEDLLSSTPKHILITGAMGGSVPTYAHLPLLFGPDGKKLSKRHGDVSLKAYRDGGFLPEAMFNYMCLLGWSYEAETTVFTREQAIERFDLSAVSKNAAIFDPEKLEWMNGVYIRALDPADFIDRAFPLVEDELGRELSGAEREQVVALGPLVQERVKLLTEVPEMMTFLFEGALSYDETSWRKVMETETTPSALDAAIDRLTAVGEWVAADIEAELRAMLDELELNARKGLQPIRVATTGSTVSPPLFETLEVLGREVTLHRLRAARAKL